MVRIKLESFFEVLFCLLQISEAEISEAHQIAAMCFILSGEVFIEDQEVRIGYCEVVHLHLIINMSFPITDQLVESGICSNWLAQFF